MELNRSMRGIGNTMFNAALEAATGMAVSSAISYLIEKRKNGSKRQLEAGAETAASTLVKQEGLDVTLYSLQQQLMKIRCAISAARRRRITDQELLEWLAQIINASYLANYYHRTLKHRNSLPLMIGSEGTDNLAISPSHRVAKRQRADISLLFGGDEPMKLHDVLKKLKSIDIHAFLLMVNVQPQRPMKTYLYMEHNILLYRDKERQQVMNFLFEPSRAGGNNVDILPIVGPEGGGKTSLALYCFDDPKVQHHFSLKLYIPSSNISYRSYNFSNIWRDIVWEFYHTYETCYYYDENTLLAMVKQILSSERFLLVLDHIRPVNSVAWNALWDCLRCGKKGSKVILISHVFYYERCKKIVNPEGMMPVMVDGFPEDEYMSFFKEHAFGGADPEDYPELAGMGREIAKKMNGSIWGAMILGELLRDNLTAPFWSNFLQAGFLSPLARSKVVPLNRPGRSKYIWSVIQIMCLLLPKSLLLWYFVWYHRPVEDEVKTFRELTVLGPNHCTPLIKDGNNREVRFLASKHVYLNRCTTFVATCKPF